MEICRHNDHIEISELDPFLAELLRQIPASGNPDGVAAAEQRLFSSPANRRETELCAEWKMYVEPELRRLFQSATETVAADLEQLNGNEKSVANRTLRIPAKHADAWHSFGDVETMTRKSQILDEWCAKIGRDPKEIVRSTSVGPLIGGIKADPEPYVKAGFTDFVVHARGPDWDLGALREILAWRKARG